MKLFTLVLCVGMLCITTASRGLPQPHHLHKRQDGIGNIGDVDACLAAINNNQCMNGYYQSYVTLLLECDNRELAVSVENFCKRSSSGTLCGSVNINTLFESFFTTCSNSSTTCSSDCQDLLTSTRAELGCCIKYYNDTEFGHPAFNNSLWSLCNVEVVTEECGQGLLKLPETIIDPTCDDNRIYHELICRTQYLESQLDIITESCKFINTDTLSLDSITDCTVNEEGKYCKAELDYTSSVSFAAFYNCANTSTCDPLCIESLNNITSCCFINEYNGTNDYDYEYDYDYGYDWLSYEFWSQCGLDSPGFCESRFNNDPVNNDPASDDAAILKAPGIVVTLAVVLSKYF